MVMGHTNSFGGYFDKFIHAFHVPMFFVISGYLFRVNSYSLSDIIKKRIKSLLVPYMVPSCETVKEHKAVLNSVV